MRHRKGVLTTYIKIILVILLIAVAIYFSLKIIYREYDANEIETIKTDMLLIQGKTEVIAQKVEIKEKGAEYIGTKLSEKQDEEKIQNLIQKGIIDIDSKKHNYYCIDKEDLKELGLNDIEIDDYYIVDYKQNDIISVEEIQKQDGSIVYKLSEMK